LRQRLALIHLKPRSWQQTRELLEKALDVRFRKISDAENRWILERDPEVVRWNANDANGLRATSIRKGSPSCA
jgi:hypothetical protein